MQYLLKLVLILTIVGTLRPLWAESPVVTAPLLLPELPEGPLRSMEETVVSFLLPFIPHEYKNDKKWGKTTQVMDGLHVERDGFKIETRRKWKTVNHGTWTRYEVHLVDPKNNFKLSAANYAETDQGLKFDLNCDAKLKITGRLSQWNRGIQLISLSADADASVRLRMSCLLSLQLDPSKFPPDVLLRPSVTDANLQMLYFRLNRISEIHGPLVKQLSYEVREILEDKIAEENEKLADKINQAIEKQKSKLRLSFPDLLKTPWGNLTRLAKPAE